MASCRLPSEASEHPDETQCRLDAVTNSLSHCRARPCVTHAFSGNALNGADSNAHMRFGHVLLTQVRSSAVAGTRSAISNTPAIVQQKLALLEKISTLNRGALASSMDKFEVETLVKPLEQARGMMPFEGQPPSIDGKWQLVYSSVEAFRWVQKWPACCGSTGAALPLGPPQLLLCWAA